MTITDKILVTYSTRAGSTIGVSEAIGKTLSDLGEKVDVIPVKDIKDLSKYKAVIAGSPIQAGKWLPEAMDFIQSFKSDLDKKPVAIFLVCMTLTMSKGNNYRNTVSGWLDPVRQIVHPVSEGLFKGVLDIKRISSFSDRFKFRLSVMFGVWKERDYRDWSEISTWTRDLKSLLDKK